MIMTDPTKVNHTPDEIQYEAFCRPLYRRAMRHFSLKSRWEASRRPNHVLAWMMGEPEAAQLPAWRLRKTAEAFARDCAAHIDSGEREADQSRRQSRRRGCRTAKDHERLAPLDAEMLRRVEVEGWSQRRVSREYGKALSTIQCALKRARETRAKVTDVPVSGVAPEVSPEIERGRKEHGKPQREARRSALNDLPATTLQRPRLLVELHGVAAEAGLVDAGPGGVLTVLACAARARRTRAYNPVALFRSLVETPEYHEYPSGDDTMRAELWMRQLGMELPTYGCEWLAEYADEDMRKWLADLEGRYGPDVDLIQQVRAVVEALP